jgi:uncharacterized lipoprotein YddW (UPF0748 family)
MKIMPITILFCLLAGCGGSTGSTDAGSDALDGFDGISSDGDSGNGDPADGDSADGDSVSDARRVVEVTLSPDEVQLQVGQETDLFAVARYSDDATVNVTSLASWATDPEGVVTIDSGRVTPVAEGDTLVRARYEGVTSNPSTVQVGPASQSEARGVWVTRWNYSSAADIATIVENLADHGFNQMYFQIRGNADAYYQSSVEPWASGLTGVLGRDPGWDPLQTAIDAAHPLGIEVHAWLNTFPAWNCGAALPQSEGIPHVIESHPEWVAADEIGVSMLGNCAEGYVFLSPGHPDARAHVRNVVEDILNNYDVDGIHLDYIRYPGTQYSHDAQSELGYADAQVLDPDLTWENWQRSQVNEMVAAVWATIDSQRPEVVLSASVWFIYENIWGWSGVSQGYHQYYQDPRAWTAAGNIDVVVPMIYFPLTEPPGERLDFATMLADHIQGNPDRMVYAGIHGDYDDFAEIEAEIEKTRELDSRGFLIFAYPYIEDHAYWDDFASGPLSEDASVPDMPWK